MKKTFHIAMLSALAAILLVPALAQTPAPQAAPKSAPTKAAPAAKAKPAAVPAPTDQQIADAKAKGLVWANSNTKVYHSEGQFYGKTKNGKFMTMEDAAKAGFKAAKQPATKKAAPAARKATDKK